MLINDYRLNKKNLWTPMLVYLIIDLLLIIAYFILKAKIGFENSDIMNIDIIMAQKFDVGGFPNSIWYLVGMGVLGIAGFVQVLVALAIGNHSLNLERFHKCEIFYRSQPLSIWLYSLSKYIIAIVGPILILILTGIVNLLLIIPFLSPFMAFNLPDALAGLGVSLLLYSRSILVLGSIGFLISGIFKEKAFIKLLWIILVLQIILVIAHLTLDFPLINMSEYFTKLINPIGGIGEALRSDSIESLDNFRQAMEINTILFNWHTGLQLLVSGIFFGLGVIIYKTKEVI